jgi:hypothetical protein
MSKHKTIEKLKRKHPAFKFSNEFLNALEEKDLKDLLRVETIDQTVVDKYYSDVLERKRQAKRNKWYPNFRW